MIRLYLLFKIELERSIILSQQIYTMYDDLMRRQLYFNWNVLHLIDDQTYTHPVLHQHVSDWLQNLQFLSSNLSAPEDIHFPENHTNWHHSLPMQVVEFVTGSVRNVFFSK